jgi:hypothetical protein
MPQPIDESHEGSLRDGDNIRNGDHFYDEYGIEGVQGWIITVTMTSNEFVPKLEAFQPDVAGAAGPEAVLGNGTKAELSFVARDGRYNIEASTAQPTKTGSYKLRIQTRPPVE